MVDLDRGDNDLSFTCVVCAAHVCCNTLGVCRDIGAHVDVSNSVMD